MDESFYWLKEEFRGDTKCIKVLEWDKNDTLAIATKKGVKGTKLLSDMKKDASCTLVMSVGHLKTGKSFLMNCLSGHPTMFAMNNSFKACTTGVDMSGITIHHSWLANTCGLESNPNAPSLGWIDVGTCDDPNEEIMMSLPFLLLSKVVIWNHKGAPTRHALLDELGILAAMADHVHVAEEVESKLSKFMGGVKSLRASFVKGHDVETEETKNVPKFGHLHCVFRDFTFESTREGVYHQLFDIEDEVVPESAKTTTSTSPPPKKNPRRSTAYRSSMNRGSQQFTLNQGAVERNSIRRLLLSRFASITCWLFPQPADPETLQKYKELPIELVNPLFCVEAKKLMAAIAKQTISPSMFLGSRLTGPRIAELMKQFINSLNDEGRINIVASQFSSYEKDSANNVADVVLSEYEDALLAIKQEFPIPQDYLKERIDLFKAKMLKKFKKEAEVKRSVRKKVEEELSQAAQTIATDMEKTNFDTVMLHVQLAIDKHAVVMREAFLEWCDKHPDSHPDSIDDQYRELKANFSEQVEGQLSLFTGVTLSKEYIVLLANAEERMHDMLTLKTLENNEAIQTKEIGALRHRAASLAQGKERQRQEKLNMLAASKKEESKE